MSYFEKNIQAIEDTKKFLCSRMEDVNDYDKDNNINDIIMYDTKDAITSMEITYNSKSYRLNSLYHPVREAQVWAEQFKLNNIGFITVIFGLGNGIFVRELLKRLDGNILLIYEPSKDVFFNVLENYDISDILGSNNVSLTVEGINDIEIKNLLGSHVTWLNLKSRIICNHPHYDIIFKESIKVFDKIILDNKNMAIVNNSTDVATSSKIIDNIIKNLSIISRCNIITDLIGKFDNDVPAVIVASGPSLDKNIEDLKLAKGRVVIFAVDSAVKYLLAHDIEPDFIVTLDPSKSLRHLENERCKELPIFSLVDSRPEIIVNSKKVIFYNLDGYVKKLYVKLGKKMATLNSGGSVATGAFSICETLGFKRIILVGQDLAYSGENTHAGGKITDVSGAGRFIEIVEDIYGNPIKTRYDWYIYIRWFEDAVDLFEGEEVIDATEGGAKIKGTTIMTLKEAIDKYCLKQVDCKKIISALVPTLNQVEIGKIHEFILKDLADLADMKEKTERASEISDKLLSKYNKSLSETTSSQIKNKELSKLNNEMEKKDVYTLIDWDIAAATSDHISDLYIYAEDEKENKLATYQKAKVIYAAMANSVDRIKPMLEQALQYFAPYEEGHKSNY